MIRNSPFALIRTLSLACSLALVVGCGPIANSSGTEEERVIPREGPGPDTLIQAGSAGAASTDSGAPGEGGAGNEADDEAEHAPALPAACSKVEGSVALDLVENHDALLLDVRSPTEYAAGHAEGAQNIPLDELAGRLDELPLDLPIITYCASGNRSGRAVELLCAEAYWVLDLGTVHQYPK